LANLVSPRDTAATRKRSSLPCALTIWQ
jgi:hypothetical protein